MPANMEQREEEAKEILSLFDNFDLGKIDATEKQLLFDIREGRAATPVRIAMLRQMKRKYIL